MSSTAADRALVIGGAYRKDLRMPDTALILPGSNPGKFQDPDLTANGEPRAFVSLSRLRDGCGSTPAACATLPATTATSNRARATTVSPTCRSPRSAPTWTRLPIYRRVEEIGFTGGEPFLNRELPAMLGEALARGYRALVLTNAMKPMQRRKAKLLDAAIAARRGADGARLDRSFPAGEARGGARSGHLAADAGGAALAGSATASRVHVARPYPVARTGSARSRRLSRALFAAEAIPGRCDDPGALVFFPEMDVARGRPGDHHALLEHPRASSPEQMMCASSRMVLKRKGAEQPVVVPCTLLPYDPQFELGRRLAGSADDRHVQPSVLRPVLRAGGASCSARLMRVQRCPAPGQTHGRGACHARST